MYMIFIIYHIHGLMNEIFVYNSDHRMYKKESKPKKKNV